MANQRPLRNAASETALIRRQAARDVPCYSPAAPVKALAPVPLRESFSRMAAPSSEGRPTFAHRPGVEREPLGPWGRRVSSPRRRSRGRQQCDEQTPTKRFAASRIAPRHWRPRGHRWSIPGLVQSSRGILPAEQAGFRWADAVDYFYARPSAKALNLVRPAALLAVRSAGRAESRFRFRT